jgi:hypothetical protein
MLNRHKEAGLPVPGWGLRSVRASRSERARTLPGDDLIPSPLASLTQAITVDRAPAAVWPWIAQMGAGRAGWYSYDWIDNGGDASASRVIPALQRLEVGQVFPALPGTPDGFVVLAYEAPRFLILGWPSSHGGPPHVTWTFVLESQDERTRLIVRARGSRAYRFHGLPPFMSKAVAAVVHFMMERRQLLGIARRAEGASSNGVGATSKEVVA